MDTPPITNKLQSIQKRTSEQMQDLAGHERTMEELLESLKTSMEQIMAGDYRPALEVLDEIDRKSADDAHVR